MLYGLADCNNFFCSCERVFHPELRERPVVVLSNNDGCIIARSNESKALGLEMGTPFYQVRERLESLDVAVFSSNYTLYGDMSRRVMSMLRRYCPRIEVYSIDEAFLDLTGMGTPDAVAEYCRGMVSDVTRGTGIPVSVGIAPTRTLAKVATRYAKRYKGYRGVCVIDTEERRRKALEMFPIGDVWGIGRRHKRRLEAMGVTTAWQFTQLTARQVQSAFTVVGLRTWRELRGEDCIDIDQLAAKQTICTSRSFPDRGLDRLADVEEAVANFASQCVRKLREQRSACGIITVFAHTSMFRPEDTFHSIHVNTAMPVATSCLNEVVGAAVRALRHEWPGDGVFFYKRAGVIVSAISPDANVQLSLFDPYDRDKLRAAQNAIDSVNRACGHNTVRTAVQGVSKRWNLKNEYISRHYTTSLSEVIRV